MKSCGLPGLTWKCLQWDVREDVMAAADHNCIKDRTLLPAFVLGDNLPLARGGEVWAFLHTEDSCLKHREGIVEHESGITGACPVPWERGWVE